MVQVRKTELRDEILSAARQEFLEKGFRGATLRAIAQKAGCSVGNLYAYFGNKDELFSAVAESRWFPLLRTLDEVMPPSSTHDPAKRPFEERVERMLRSVEIIHRNRDDFCLLLLKSDGIGAQHLIDDLIRRIREDVLASCRYYQQFVPHGVNCEVSDLFIDNVADFHLSCLTRFLASDMTLEEMKRCAIELMTYTHFGFRALYAKQA